MQTSWEVLLCLCSPQHSRCFASRHPANVYFICAVLSIAGKEAATMWMRYAHCYCSKRCRPLHSGALAGCCCRSLASEKQVRSILLVECAMTKVHTRMVRLPNVTSWRLLEIAYCKEHVRLMRALQESHCMYSAQTVLIKCMYIPDMPRSASADLQSAHRAFNCRGDH